MSGTKDWAADDMAIPVRVTQSIGNRGWYVEPPRPLPFSDGTEHARFAVVRGPENHHPEEFGTVRLVEPATHGNVPIVEWQETLDKSEHARRVRQLEMLIDKQVGLRRAIREASERLADLKGQSKAQADEQDRQKEALRAWEATLTAREQAANDPKVLRAIELLNPATATIPPCDAEQHWHDLFADQPLQLVRDQAAELGYVADPALLRRATLAVLLARLTGQLVLLGGPPGSGKSSLADLVSRALADQPAAMMSVRPEWLDASDLLGFLLPGQAVYQPTDFLEVVRRAGRKAVDLVVLDEMNIARIENYGADLLTQLERSKSPDGGHLTLYADAQLEHLDRRVLDGEDDGTALQQLRARYPASLPLPPSLVVVGTLNDDATTHELSPKVRDRALGLRIPTYRRRPCSPAAPRRRNSRTSTRPRRRRPPRSSSRPGSC